MFDNRQFLKDLCPQGKVEFNDLTTTYTLDDALKQEKDIYFLASVQDRNKRNKDNDVIFKNYFVCDFDIREKYLHETKQLAEDILLEAGLEIIKENLAKNGYGDWRYIVFSGNGYHVYYVGKGDTYGVKEYSEFVEHHYQTIDTFFDDVYLKTDHACKNIGRIMRLPGTKNYKRKVKYNLEPCECTIVDMQDVYTDKFDSFAQITENKQEQEVIKQAMYSIKKSMSGLDDHVLDEILQIDIFDLIREYNGLEMQPDKKNLQSPKDKSNIGAFVVDNILYLTGTHHFSDEHKGYNSFTFVKTHYKLDNKGTFEWFKDKYPRLKDLVKASKVLEVKDIQVDFTTKVPFTWGLQKIDERFGRYDIGTYTVIIGESLSGKTEYTFFQARENAKTEKVLYISLEMTPENMIKRFAIKKAGITPIQRSDKSFTEQQKQIVIDNIALIKNMSNLQIVGLSNATLQATKETIKNYYMQGYRLFYIDNMGFILCEGEEIEYTKNISRELKEMTNQYPIAINLLHHFKKGNSNDRKGPRGLADIRSSGKIENDADNVLQVWRDLDPESPQETRAEVMLLLQKERSFGNVSTATIYFSRGEYVGNNPFTTYK